MDTFLPPGDLLRHNIASSNVTHDELCLRCTAEDGIVSGQDWGFFVMLWPARRYKYQLKLLNLHQILYRQSIYSLQT